MSQPEARFNRRAAGERILNDVPLEFDAEERPAHPLDQAEARKTLRKLLSWYYREREIQAENRLQMSIDADYYDGDQWDPADAATLEERGQVPLVFNEVAVMCDWLIGTERRARVDWSVLPRAEDDVQLADVKTKVLKYVSDVNRTTFNCSRAFEDTVKVGVGWVTPGCATTPPRTSFMTSTRTGAMCLGLDGHGAGPERCALPVPHALGGRGRGHHYAPTAPRRAGAGRAAREEFSAQQWAEDEFFFQGHTSERHVSGTSGSYLAGGANIDSEARRCTPDRVPVRMLAPVQVVTSGLQGLVRGALGPCAARRGAHGGSIERVAMRMHVAVFTEGHLLALGPTPMRQIAEPDAHLWRLGAAALYGCVACAICRWT